MPQCHTHPDKPSVTNLDGEELCHDCANEWLAGERQAYFEQAEMDQYLAWKDDVL